MVDYHSGIYFRDTLFSRNPVECLVAKFSRILYFAGYSMRENICHAVIYHRVRIYGDLGVLNVRRERHGSDLPVQFQHQRLSRIPERVERGRGGEPRVQAGDE